MSAQENIASLLQELTNIMENSKETTDAVMYSVSKDEEGNAFHWFSLELPQHIVPATQALFTHGARLAMVTAYNMQHLQDPVYEVCYHFELEGVVINVTVLLDVKNHAVPSISSIYANADWHEREMMELYDIEVQNHPNPRRLFLSEELDSGIMGEAVPLSIMMNGACTVDLWERILKDRNEAEQKVVTSSSSTEV